MNNFMVAAYKAMHESLGPIGIDDSMVGTTPPPEFKTSTMHIMAHPSPALYKMGRYEIWHAMHILTAEIAGEGAFPGIYADPYVANERIVLSFIDSPEGQHYQRVRATYRSNDYLHSGGCYPNYYLLSLHAMF